MILDLHGSLIIAYIVNVMYQCALIVLVTRLVCLLHTLVLVPHSSFCKRCQVPNLRMVFVRADLYQWWPLCDGKYNIYCMWTRVFYLYSFSSTSIIISRLTLFKVISSNNYCEKNLFDLIIIFVSMIYCILKSPVELGTHQRQLGEEPSPYELTTTQTSKV